MLNPFTWIREQAAKAIILGTADGLQAVTPDGQEPPADLSELRQLLTSTVQTPKSLPAAKDEEPKKKGK